MAIRFAWVFLASATMIAAALVCADSEPFVRAQDEEPRPDEPAPIGTIVPWSASELHASPPLKELTTSGRVRLTRHVAVLFEGSAQMDDSFLRADGLRGHKGAEAKLQNALHLNTRTEALWFNFAVYRGGEGEPLRFGELIHGVKRQRLAAASEWVRNQPFVGTPDLAPALRRAVSESPDSIVIIAGSLPARPSECPEDAELGTWFLSRLSHWADGKPVPPLHILGIGLDNVAGAFFQRLGSATGGTLTEVGRALDQ